MPYSTFRACRFWLSVLTPKLSPAHSLTGACLLLSATALSGAEQTKINFNIAASEAAQTLKVFAQQAQREIIFSTKAVAGIKTNALQGEFTAREGLSILLAGTNLRVFEDEKTGSIAIDVAEAPKKTSAASAVSRPAVLGANSADPSPTDETIQLSEFVVTGVFTRTKKQDVTASVSSVNASQLSKIVPVSAADLLWNVPSVYVNSSLGEIRNIVYSRGVSANTSNGDLGYYYVSMQEDGLPVTNIGYSNWGPDYFLRPDVMLERVEAVRGGSASITSANAPGGIFNYISRRGTEIYSGEARVRFGLEGDNSPYYRTDLWVGGPGPKGTTFSLGGFYRVSDGARNPGYRMNDGGQIRLNLRKEYGSGAGSITLYAKFLDDHNGWFEFYPAKDFENPHIAPGIDRFATNLHRPAQFSYVTGGIDQKKDFDSTSLVHSVQRAIGVDWTHDFGAGWVLSNNLKLSRSTTDWNTSASVALRDIGRGSLFSNLNILTSGPARVPAGTWVFKDRETGQVMARIQSDGTNSGSGSAGTTGLTVLENHLPRQDLLSGAVWSNNGLVFERGADELMDQLVLNKRIGSHLFTLGTFFAYSDASNFNTTSGRTVSPVDGNPEPLDVTLITAANSPYGPGVTLQITNPEGFSAEGSGFTLNEMLQKQLSLFFGHNWEISKKLTLDWGLRYEHLNVTGLNNLGSPVAGSNYDPSFGGADGNPLTIYDNRFLVRNPTDWRYDRNVDTFSWSGALNYTLNPNNSVYLRYTKGEKAPDLSFFTGLTNAFAIKNYAAVPQTIEQWELGYKVRAGSFNAVVTPFYSKLGDILNAPLTGTNVDNTTYSLPPLYSEVETYGVELETNYAFNQHFSVRAVATWQHAKATRWVFWNTGSNGPADDTINDVSGRKADNNPDWIVNLTPTYQQGNFTGSISWKYMGARPANIANMFTLPAYDQTDLFLSWAFNDHFSVSLNVNNVFDGEGVVNWAGYGDQASQFNRQNFTTRPDPNTTFLIVPIQPRAYFLSATYKF
ncbi:MAG TPA: TonB-dependent receptor [Opitutaceae bacterium]|nr:TonB-dependent receptor [Opitutaceae bacterium]